MNAQQRKYLIEKIQTETNQKIKSLGESKLEYPSASNYIFKAIMNDKLELQSKEIILNAIKQKALNGKEGHNWLSEDRMGWEKERTIKLNIPDIIVVPQDYKDEFERVKKHNEDIDEKINLLKIKLNTIEMRVQLASDKTLQNLINQVDDMGDLSLVDNQLKLN